MPALLLRNLDVRSWLRAAWPWTSQARSNTPPLRFGNVFRDAVGGTTYLEFCNTRNAQARCCHCR